jgi:tetratricopeptide (TPR) repeat protein
VCNNPAVWPQWQPLLPHVLAAVDPSRPVGDAADEVSWLLDRAALYQQTRGNARVALALFQRAYILDRDRLGVDHPDTLASASNLAADLHALGEYQQARTLNEDTLTRYRRVLGEDHPSTRLSERNLAELLRKLDDAVPS